jgi:hypothetical protein
VFGADEVLGAGLGKEHEWHFSCIGLGSMAPSQKAFCALSVWKLPTKLAA